MELTGFIKVFTLALGMIAFVYVLAWVFQGTTEDDRSDRRPFQFPRLGRRKKNS
jgi:hypothetical protein